MQTDQVQRSNGLELTGVDIANATLDELVEAMSKRVNALVLAYDMEGPNPGEVVTGFHHAGCSPSHAYGLSEFLGTRLMAIRDEEPEEDEDEDDE